MPGGWPALRRAAMQAVGGRVGHSAGERGFSDANPREGGDMEDKICALLVHDGRGDQLSSLKQNLDDIVGVAKTCGEAAHYLQKPNPPHLVFTDTAMPDGTWQDVLKLAAKAPKPVNVIVVARSEEHTSELQSLRHLVCRLLLEKKKQIKDQKYD